MGLVAKTSFKVINKHNPKKSPTLVRRYEVLLSATTNKYK